MQTKTGFIVDGLGDFAAFKARFSSGCKVLKTDGPRSHTTSVDQIVGYSRKQVEILRRYSCTTIIVVLDFEQRSVSYDSFVAALKRGFERAYADIAVHAAVPNQSLENWYLADIAHLSRKKRFLKAVQKQQCYEGKPGKPQLKRLFQKGYTYSEVEHGPQLFCLVRFDRGRRFSDSLGRFLEVLAV